MLWTDFEKKYNLVHPDIQSDVIGASAFEDILLLQCKNCNMSIIAPAFSSHFQDCRKIPNVLADKSKKPVASHLSQGVTMDKSKKTSLGALGKKKEKKKLDLDKHCGVLLENGEYCVRSLKCKNHTLNMKRQVLGRSNSFDVLYNDSSKNSSKTQSIPAASTSPDQEVAGILKFLEGYVPAPLVIYHDPCVLELKKQKNDLLLSEIVRAK
jgi:hypothetical protein